MRPSQAAPAPQPPIERDEAALRAFAAVLVRIARRIAVSRERAIIAGQRKESSHDATR